MSKLLDPVRFDNKDIIWDYEIYNESNFKDYYHWHQCCELLFVHAGEGTIVLNNQAYNIKRGMFFLFQPFQLHHIHAVVSPITPYKRTILYIDPLIIDRHLRGFSKKHALFSTLWQQDSQSNVFDLSAQVDIIEFIYSSFNQVYESNTYDSEDITLLFLQILNVISAASSGTTSLPKVLSTQRPLRYSEEIMHWIEEHYKENVTLEQLSKETHLSVSYISRVFRRETDSNITDYLTARRIKEACLLLKTTDLAVEQIGIQVGVPNASYFNQLFKNVVGMTPLKYRNDRGR